ncbi:MAG: PAS domain S-box protein [Calditrichaeota bacterium]|nr:MAG: PAS domain S-box protein [Calditrichota bacterium]
MRDITEREAMQQALRRSEQELRLIVEASPVGIASVNARARFIRVNPAFCEIVGYAPEALQQMTFEDITHPEDVEINRHCFEELVRGERQDYVLEKRYIRNDGEIIWGQLSVVAVRDEAGNFVQTVSVLQDITARKKAEEALQAEMERNRLILKTTLDGYILADTTGKILEVNPAYCRMTGYTEAELQGMTIHQLEAMLDDRQIAERIREMVSEGGARFHTRHRCKDGRAIDLDVSISIMNTDTGPLVAGFVRDITEQRQAEEQQRKYLANLLALYEASVAFSLHLDAHKVGEKVVETLEHLLHWKRGSIWLLDEEQTRLELLAHSSMGLKGEALEEELKRVRNMVSAPGEGISGWVALHGEPVRLGDVTRDSRYICADPEIRSELCVPLKIGGRTIGSINVESEKLHAFTEDDERLLSILANQAAVAIENARLYASILSSERRYHILFQESPIPLWEEDFSEVKRYLDRLKKRRIKDFRRYFERHPQIVEECARRVKILEVNRAAIELHEADSKDALIAGLPGIFTPASYQAFKEELIAIIEGRTRLSLEASIKTLSGEERFIHLDWVVVPGSEEDLARVFVATIDITERKQAMRKMEETQEQLRSLTHHLQHVREEERSAIAREIHDELGQVLTAMKIDLSLIEQEIQGERADFQPASVLEEIRALKQLIDSTIRRVRRIITELRPEVLEDLGLVEALRWQVKEFQKRTGLRCRFHSQVSRIELPPHSRIAVFRIVQEALTNVARHARARRVRVNIRVKPPGYAISVQDDGKGISSEALTKKNTFGLLGIRERAALLGGRVNISGEPGKGTRVEIFIPQTQEFIPTEEQLLVEKEGP